MSVRTRSGALVDYISARLGWIVPRDSRLGRPLRTLRARLPTNLVGTDPLNQVLSAFARCYRPVFFVQVGANDGRQRDPLRRHIYARKWSGILIEPVPYVFQRLTETHRGNDRLSLENVAVASHDGTQTLYYLPETADDGLPQWYDALASFRKDVVLKHSEFIPDIEDRIASMDVPCVTFESLCARHSIEIIDLIQIDTEGYDFEIIKLIDLERYRPKLLMFEHLHLDDENRKACLAHMEALGYETLSDVMDTICLDIGNLGSRGRSLRQLWDHLRGTSVLTSS